MTHSVRSLTLAAVSASMLLSIAVATGSAQSRVDVPMGPAPSFAVAPVAPGRAVAAPAAAAVEAEAHALAYRRFARLSCQMGTGNALQTSLFNARAGLEDLPAGQRAAASASLDSTYAALVRAGGCEALTRPANLVVVDRFHGHTWDSPLRTVASASRAIYTEDGFAIVRTGVKFARQRGEATFTFTAMRGRERLIAGQYRFAVDAGSCDAAWRAVEGEIVARHPELRALRASDADAATPCAAFAADGKPARTELRNAESSALEVAMFLQRGADGTAYIRVDYPGLTQR